MKCLDAYRNGDIVSAECFSGACDCIRPEFHCNEYFDQMKRRLYTKDPIHYAEFADLGTSDVNWYCVDGQWKYYKNGKVVQESI